MPLRRLLSGLLVLPLAAGCASQDVVQNPPLPFHVAVIPLEPVIDESLTPAGMDGDPLEDVQLAFDPARTTTALVRELDGTSFARATELRYPTGVTREDFLARPLGEQEDYWVRAAEAAGADLLVLTDFEFAPTIWSDTNSSFWLNLPLFLIGGPFCYFVDDRDYHSNVRMRAQFFDVTPLRLQEASFQDTRNARVMELDQRLQRSDLDFWDRAGGNLGQFALSLVVPAGWLAKESDGVRSSLEQEIVASLAGDLANEARLRADLMSRAPSLYDYWVDPASVAIVSGSAGRELRGRLVLELGRSAERMDSYAWRLAPNSLPRTVVFDEGVRREDRAGAATRTYEFVVPLGSGPMPPEVRVEFEDASASARRRYTFATSAYASGS